MEENEENFRRQQEEIEALSSIYEDCFVLDSETSFTILIKENCGEVLLTVSLPPDYPSGAPPTYQKSAPFLRGRDKEVLCDLLDDIYVDNLGECVVFLWVEQIRTYLQERRKDDITECYSSDLVDNKETVDTCLDEDLLATALHNSSLCPEITTGGTIEDRKSVFQGHTATVKSADDVKAVVAKLHENKKIVHALLRSELSSSEHNDSRRVSDLFQTSQGMTAAVRMSAAADRPCRVPSLVPPRVLKKRKLQAKYK